MASASGPAGSSRKHLVLFVHGFGDSPDCWSGVFKLLRQDPRFSETFDLQCFGYSTGWFNFHLLRRIPRLKEIGRALRSRLELARKAGYRDVTLVGHSQGGLVIQYCLADAVQKREARTLEMVRAAILIATPNLGSTLLAPVRSLLFRIFENPQERRLRVLDPEMSDIRELVLDRIHDAAERSDTAWPVPFVGLAGMDDGIVLEASARGDFYETIPVPGDHSSILEPPDPTDPCYTALAENLLVPPGHRNFYEVEEYRVDVRVEPLPEAYTEQVTFGRHGKQRVIACDNRARVVRTVQFAPENRCRELFEIRYRTRNEGFLRAHPSEANLAPAQEQSAYDDYGTDCRFKFNPRAGDTFSLSLDVYKGFDQGHRDIHLHLNPRAHYRRIRQRLDLTPYVAAGYRISAPMLYYFQQDADNCDLSGRRRPELAIPPVRSDPAGVWEWELRNVREGVVDSVWDVERSAATHGVVP